MYNLHQFSARPQPEDPVEQPVQQPCPRHRSGRLHCRPAPIAQVSTGRVCYEPTISQIQTSMNLLITAVLWISLKLIPLSML